MKIYLKTEVKGDYLQVMKKFDRQLFEALQPPGAAMEIVEFTGSEKGDRVHIRFVSPIKGEWISEITEHGNNEEEAWFVDEGVRLPFGLKFWRHRHLVRKASAESCYIIDDIEFDTQNFLLNLIFYPGLFLSFYPRKFAYRKYFGK